MTRPWLGKLLLAATAVGGLLVVGLAVRGGGPTEDEWRWPRDLEPDQVAALIVLRDRYQRELLALGPTPAARLASVEVDPERRAELRLAVHDMFYRRRRRTHGRQVQANRRDELIRTHGVLAVPFLCEAVPQDRYWSARLAVQALGILAGEPRGEETRWLVVHLEAPRDMIALFGTGPTAELIGLSADLNAALGALLDPQLARRLDAELELSQPATIDQAQERASQSQAAWRTAWDAYYRDWRANERSQLASRRELERKLDLLRRGVDPERGSP